MNGEAEIQDERSEAIHQNLLRGSACVVRRPIVHDVDDVVHQLRTPIVLEEGHTNVGVVFRIHQAQIAVHAHVLHNPQFPHFQGGERGAFGAKPAERERAVVEVAVEDVGVDPILEGNLDRIHGRRIGEDICDFLEGVAREVVAKQGQKQSFDVRKELLDPARKGRSNQRLVDRIEGRNKRKENNYKRQTEYNP